MLFYKRNASQDPEVQTLDSNSNSSNDIMMSDKECIEAEEIVNDQLFMKPLNAEEEHLVNDCYDLNNKDKELSMVGREGLL